MKYDALALVGFFLFAVQPFKLGDRISVSYSSPAAANSINRSAWFEGICEKVDLRYTVVKNGSRKMFVPNSAFVTREFMVVDDVASSKGAGKRDLFPAEEAQPQHVQHMQPLYGPTQTSQRPVWAQNPQQQQQQYPWPRPFYDDGSMAQPSPLESPLGRVGPYSAAAESSDGMHTNQQPGMQADWRHASASVEPGAEASDPIRDASSSQGSNVLEWQKRETRAQTRSPKAAQRGSRSAIGTSKPPD